MKRSVLEDIPGVGPRRRELLMKQFKSIRAIREASLDQLQLLLPRDAAQAVYAYFHRKAEPPCESSQEPAGE